MSWVLLSIPIGIILLYFGSEWMVDGAKKLAFKLGVAPFIIGLTVVAFGSSMPEAITSLVSGDTPQIIIGNVVGSNIANVGLAIGLSALISPIVSKYTDIKFEIIVMIVSVTVVFIFSLFGILTAGMGLILIFGLIIFVMLSCHFKKNMKSDVTQNNHSAQDPSQISTFKAILFVILGIIFLYIGAKAFIEGSIVLAGIIGVSDLMIGLLMVAVGTSLPEICICVLAARRKEHDIAVSNIIGSIVFNSFFVLGIGLFVTSVPITHYMLIFHIPVMILFAVLMAIFIKFGNGISKNRGGILVAIYIAYIALMGLFPQLTEGIV